MVQLRLIIQWVFIMLGVGLIKIYGKDSLTCWDIGKDFRMVLTSKDFGLRWRLRRNLVLEIKKILKGSVLISSLTSVKSGLKSFRGFRQNKVRDLAILWIGKILIILLLMKTITLFGIF